MKPWEEIQYWKYLLEYQYNSKQEFHLYIFRLLVQDDVYSNKVEACQIKHLHEKTELPFQPLPTCYEMKLLALFPFLSLQVQDNLELRISHLFSHLVIQLCLLTCQNPNGQEYFCTSRQEKVLVLRFIQTVSNHSINRAFKVLFNCFDLTFLQLNYLIRK